MPLRRPIRSVPILHFLSLPTLQILPNGSTEPDLILAVLVNNCQSVCASRNSIEDGKSGRYRKSKTNSPTAPSGLLH
jgi:hypothetical protein